MQKSKIKFSVIFDTNILRGKPIRSELVDFIEFCKTKSNLESSLFIPEIVKKEYHKYFVSKVIEARNNALNGLDWLDSLLGSKTKDLLPRTKITSQDSEKALNRLGIAVISTPHSKIDLDKLIDGAVNYLPPFQESKEKGFKDSIILETVISVVGLLSKQGFVYFVSDDELLRNTLKTKTKNYKRLRIYQSIPDLESDIKLLLERFDAEFISRITEQATRIFYDPENSIKSLYFRWGIKEKIISQYRDLIYNPKPYTGFGRVLSAIATSIPERWVPKSPGTFSVSNTIYTEKSDTEKYLWQNTVVFEQTIQNTNSLRSQASRSLRLYKAEFNITWESEIGVRGKIIKPNFVKIQNKSVHSDEIYETPFLSDYLTATPSSGATISGQGTIPASASEILEGYTSSNYVNLSDLNVHNVHSHSHAHSRERNVSLNANIISGKLSGNSSSR